MTGKVTTAGQAMASVPDHATVAIGGFGVPGAPVHLMRALARSSASHLELVANNGALFDWQLGELLAQGRVRRVVASHIGLNPTLVRAFLEGRVEVELVPQGTLVERLRAGGAGIPAFFTPTGAGTLVEEGGVPWRHGADGSVVLASPPKEARVVDGTRCVLEQAIRPDVSLVRAWRGDTLGNLVFRRAARNFNPVVAAAGRRVVAEVEHLVAPGEIDPDDVHVPAPLVDEVVEVGADDKWFELPVAPAASGPLDAAGRARHRIARRVALEFRDGDCVNLGVGIPGLAAEHLPPGVQVTLQTENGIVGLGPPPDASAASHDLVDASKRPATVAPGGAIVDSAGAFAMIRSGRLDLSVLGALQVSATGDLANWMVPGQAVAGMGGAMDLVSGARRVVAATTHVDADGRPKLVGACTFPLTGSGVVDRVVTDLAVIDVTDQGFVLRELAPGVGVEQVRAATAAPLAVADDLGVMAGSDDDD